MIHKNQPSKRYRTVVAVAWAALPLLASSPGCKDEVKVSDNSSCDEVDCSGHGFCAEADGQAYCICEAGYHAEGLDCVEGGTSNQCDGVDCSGNGTCAVGRDGPLCICNPGFHANGLACEQNQPGHECDGVDCSDHGQCLVVAGDPNSPLCICDDGYHAVGDTNCVADAAQCFPSFQDPPGLVTTADATDAIDIKYVPYGDGILMYSLALTGQVHEDANHTVTEQELELRLTPITADGVVGASKIIASSIWATPKERGGSRIVTATTACSQPLVGVSVNLENQYQFHSIVPTKQILFQIDDNGQVVGERTTDELGLSDGYYPMNGFLGTGDKYAALGHDGIALLDCNLNIINTQELRSAFEIQSEYDVYLSSLAWDGNQRIAVTGISVEGQGKGITWNESLLATVDASGNLVGQPSTILTELGAKFIWKALTACGPNCFAGVFQRHTDSDLFRATGPAYLVFFDGHGMENQRSFLPIPSTDIRSLIHTENILMLSGTKADATILCPFDFQGHPLDTNADGTARSLDLPAPPTDADWMFSGGMVSLENNRLALGLLPNGGSQAGLPFLAWFGCD